MSKFVRVIAKVGAWCVAVGSSVMLSIIVGQFCNSIDE